MLLLCWTALWTTAIDLWTGSLSPPRLLKCCPTHISSLFVVLACHELELVGFDQLLSFLHCPPLYAVPLSINLSNVEFYDWKSIIEPGTAGWIARTLPLCYAVPLVLFLLRKILAELVGLACDWTIIMALTNVPLDIRSNLEPGWSHRQSWMNSYCCVNVLRYSCLVESTEHFWMSTTTTAGMLRKHASMPCLVSSW